MPELTRLAGSVAPAVRELLRGPLRRGVALGRGHLDFDGYVVSVTAPGAPRMPNGIEVELLIDQGQPAALGEGFLVVAGTPVSEGPLWEPRALVSIPSGPAGPAPDVPALAGRGGGLTPEGDDLIAGFAAGLVLFHHRDAEAKALADAASLRTTSLSATLLRHAAAGELPEPAHDFLGGRGEAALLGWGSSSGRKLLEGLRLAGALR